MVSPRTTTRPSNDLVKPSTSMAISEDGGRMSDVGGLISEDAEERGGSVSRPVPVSDRALSIISWPPSQAKSKRADAEERKAGLSKRHLPSALRHLASVVRHLPRPPRSAGRPGIPAASPAAPPPGTQVSPPRPAPSSPPPSIPLP